MGVSTAYQELNKRGSFPGQIDLWAEAGRYFKQLHTEMISHLLGQIQDSLDNMVYLAVRETSLQITERREPDIHIRRKSDLPSTPAPEWDYPAAATTAATNFS